MQYHETGTTPCKEDFQEQTIEFLEHVHVAHRLFSVVDGFIFLCMGAEVMTNLKINDYSTNKFQFCNIANINIVV